MKPYIPAVIVLILVLAALGGWALYAHSHSAAVATQAVDSSEVRAQAVIATSTATTTASTQGPNSLPVYTLAQIAQHATAASCWLAIDGTVYDVTTFIPMHPGGPAILKGCGKDASALFHSVPRHAEENVESTVAVKYIIGTLAPGPGTGS